MCRVRPARWETAVTDDDARASSLAHRSLPSTRNGTSPTESERSSRDCAEGRTEQLQAVAHRASALPVCTSLRRRPHASLKLGTTTERPVMPGSSTLSTSRSFRKIDRWTLCWDQSTPGVSWGGGGGPGLLVLASSTLLLFWGVSRGVGRRGLSVVGRCGSDRSSSRRWA